MTKLQYCTAIKVSWVGGAEWVWSMYILCQLYSAVKEASCNEGDFRNSNQLGYTWGQFWNGTGFRIAYIEMCINGSYRTLCNEDLSIESLSYICSSVFSYQLGYPGPLYGSNTDYIPPISARGVYNISCDDGYFSTSSCNYNLESNYSTGCSTHDGPALVTCVDGMYEYH